MSAPSVETLIIGAGVIGSSVAMHLAQLGMSSIRVIDLDLEGLFSSSELNAGGVRATWVQPVNIRFSQLSIDYFASVAQQVGYRACGYLWLHSPQRLGPALKARDRQQAMGWPVEAWDLAELQRKVPFIDKVSDLAGAVFAPRDGLVNPNLLKNHFREIARSKGVVFDDRMRVRGVERSTTTSEISVTCELATSPLSAENKKALLSSKEVDYPRERVVYKAKQVINCAGAWAPEVAEILGYFCPSKPVRRQACIFDCKDVDLTPYGMVVDTSGVYFHPEATNGLSGFLNRDEPTGINFDYDDDGFFMNVIWPLLYERSSKFERLKHLTGWAGAYEVAPDDCAIIGAVELGEAGRAGNVFEAHSFSGHGVMHSYAAGLALAERIVHGRYETLDAEELAGRRFVTGKLIHESQII